jgi:hypothetical protein
MLGVEDVKYTAAPTGMLLVLVDTPQAFQAAVALPII